MKSRYLTVSEFAGLFNLGKSTVYRATLTGQIPAVRVLGRVRIPYQAAEALLRASESLLEARRG